MLAVSDRLVWSKSQANSLRECARKVLFPLSKDAEIERLKRIKNRYLWAGSMAHDAIGDVIKLLRQGERASSIDATLATVKEKMRESYKLSTQGDLNHRLFEHEYSVVVSAEAWKGHWNTVETSLRWFFASKWFSRLSTLGPECWKAVNDVLEFDVNGIKAYVKIDCGIEVDGKFHLMDWTTSTPKEQSEKSLLVQALYAHEVWGAEVENTSAVCVSLLDGKAYHANITEEALMETHLLIEEEAAGLEEIRAKGVENIFQMDKASNPITCQRCSYQKACFPQGLGHGG